MASPKVIPILAHSTIPTQFCVSCNAPILADENYAECFTCGGLTCNNASCPCKCLCELYGEAYDDDTRHEVLRSLGLDENADDQTIVKAVEQATKNELEKNRKKKLEAVRQTKKRFAFDA